MQDLPTPHGIHGHGSAGLASQLAAIADEAARAAMYADGEYIPQLTREEELRKSLLGAGTVAARVEAAKRQVRKLGTGDNCVEVLDIALLDLEAGRREIQEGVRMTSDLLENGVVVIDAVATHTAAAHFRQAAAIIRGISDIATLDAVPLDQLYSAIVDLR
jgi:hypothetical protein